MIKNIDILNQASLAAHSAFVEGGEFGNAIANNIIDKAWDAYYEEMLQNSSAEEDDEDDFFDRTPTPCGCTIFNDCCECSSYPVCR